MQKKDVKAKTKASKEIKTEDIETETSQVKTKASKDKTKTSKTEAKVKTRTKPYFSFNTRLITFSILFVIVFALCLSFARSTLKKNDFDPVKYYDTENVDYKVYLKENDFYTEEFLPKNKAYIASLIDYIDVNLKYFFTISDLTKMNFDYQVLAELVIENTTGTKRYFEKEYQLGEIKNQFINGNNELAIDESVKINYGEFNELANRFRSNYGVETNSYLRVFLNIDKTTDEELNYSIKEQGRFGSITIPLSERAIEISIDSTNKTTTKQVLPKSSMSISISSLILEIVLFIASAYLLTKIIKYVSMLIVEPTLYDKTVNKILKEYDRLIVEIKTRISFDGLNIIDVTKFTELLDVRDNLKVPINYYNIIKHEKGIFYIKSDNDIYQWTVKNVDLEREKAK